MKKIILLLLPACLLVSGAFAQSGNIGIGTNTPTSRLQVNGSVSFAYRVVTASSLLDAGDYTVEYNGTSAATLTLPDAATCKGRSYHLKNISTTIPTPVVTIAPQSGQTADGKTTWLLDTKNELAYMLSDGANWRVYAQMVPTAKTDTTGGAWLEGGNSDPSTTAKKFGTIANNDLPVITNNTERMRITSSGNIGIGTSSPAYKLDVSGTARCTGALTIGAYTLPNTDGTSNQVLTTGGSGAVTWQSLSAIVTSGWALTGNSGITPGTNFIGTTDNQSLVFKANNIQAGKIDLPLSNTSFGYQSAAAVTTATAGTYVGYQAGFKNTTGLNNTAVGAVALSSNTTGASNTAIGSNALKSTTTASGNTAVGNSCLTATTTGGSNTAQGAYSMQSNTTGSSNTAQGYSSLGANTTGTNNTGVGGGSLQTNTTGLSNTAHGSGALQFSTTANDNTSIGAFSLQYTTTGGSNSVLGYGAGGANTGGSYNTMIGNVAGATNTTGTENTFVGSGADASSAALTNASAFGYNAKVATSNSIVLGGTGSSAVNVGIGTTSPIAKVDIANGVTTNNTVVNATGSINDYLQYNIQNTSTGTAAQSGYAATADNGTNTTGFAWLGINNSTFNYPTAYNIGGANDVSYVGSGQDMYIANANNTKSIIFSTGTATTPYFAERMRVTNAGNVGIGTAAPTAKLEVNSGTAGVSGIKFTNMTKSSAITSGVGMLGVDASGNVVLASASTSERNNYVLVKSAADFPAAVGGVITLLANTQYEINGQVIMTNKIDLNQAVIKGSDATDDMLVYVTSSGGLFTGANGGVVKDLTLVASTAGGAVFNINAAGAAQNLIVQHCFMANSASLGTIRGFGGTVYIETIAFQNNTNGITYQDNTNFVEVNALWDVSNHNTYEKFVGTFGVIQILGGDRLTTSANAAIGIDITGITSISAGSVKQLMFTGTGTFVNGTFSGAWEVESYGLNTQKDDVSNGCIYMSSSAATTFGSTNTATKLLGTTTSASLFRTTSPSSNRLTYVGSKTKTFTASCSLTGTQASSAIVYSFYIAKNGVVLPESKQQVKFANSTDQQSVTILCTVPLAPNDYVEVWAANNTDLTALTVASLNLVIK